MYSCGRSSRGNSYQIVLIPSMGRSGAVAGQVISNTAACAGQFLFAWRVYGNLVEPVFLCRNPQPLPQWSPGVVAAQGGYDSACFVLESGIFVFMAAQFWGQKTTALEALSKGLWRSAEPEPVI